MLGITLRDERTSECHATNSVIEMELGRSYFTNDGSKKKHYAVETVNNTTDGTPTGKMDKRHKENGRHHMATSSNRPGRSLGEGYIQQWK